MIEFDKDSVESSTQKFDLEASQIREGKPIKRLLTPLLSKKVPIIPDESERKPLPIFSSNIFSLTFYSWLLPMLGVGYKRTLTQNDLWYLNGELTIEESHQKFIDNLQKRIKDKENFSKWTVPLAMFETFKFKFLLAILWKSLSNVAQCFTPLLIKNLIETIQSRIIDPSIPLNQGSGYAVGIVLLVSIQSILSNQSLLLSKYIGGQTRTILTKTLLEKTLVIDNNLNNDSKTQFSSGSIISLLGSDLSRIDLAFGQLPFAFAFPIPMIIGTILLIINVKYSALTGIGLILIFLGLLSIPLTFYMKFRNKSNVFTDQRVSLMREVIQSLKFIKFYAWEDAYQKIIVNVRNKESSLIFKMQYLVAVFFTLIMSILKFSSMVVFLTLYGTKGLSSSAPIIFSSLSLLNVLTDNIIDFPLVLSKGFDGLVAFKRITEYLESPDEGNIEDYYNNEIITKNDIAIKFSNAEFQYKKISSDTIDDSQQEVNEKQIKNVDIDVGSIKLVDSQEFTILKNIDLEIKKGEFIMITGAIGSGKSSLLAAIFGLISKKSGKVAINGSSLLCNSPWIENTTVRENITFGNEYDALKYQNVIEACSLRDDLKNFPAGDSTEIGERGVTLSGGQKSRINLARAIYADPEILVFDDVLNAVDAKVGESIMSNLFLGLIKHKTRILTTHQLSVLDHADRIIFSNGDGSIDFGTKSQLMNSNNRFESLITQFANKINDQSSKSKNSDEIEEVKPQKADGRLILDEERAVNSIPLSIYVKYLKSGQGIFGIFAVPILVILVTLSTFSSLFSNVWLTYWIDSKFPKLNDPQYIAIYVTTNVVSAILYIFQCGLVGYITVEASRDLTIRSIFNILHVPMKFLDTTPIGRVLNRFSKDINSLDNEIGELLQLFIYLMGSSIGVIVLAIVYVPYFAAALPVIFTISFFMVSFYQASSREVKRLEAINRSFILNNFNEVLTGLSTIKLFGSQERFIAKNDLYADKLNEVYFVVIANQRWISVNLTLTASLLSFILSMLTVSRQFNISAAAAGLLTTYMINFTEILTNLLTNYSELENQMNSVERIMHYAYKLEQEPSYRILERQPDVTWPHEGDITFENASFRYRDGLPLILKNFSCNIKGGEKIGICGRTGAGKSSLLSALYRLGELSEGKIIIDGIDISKIGLYDLRSKLTIIPQDPVLFQGTLRQNLDPFDERTDDELWDALRRSNLIGDSNLEKIKSKTDDDSHKFHLESKVEDEGSNFSLGERQLIALARALVRKTKILIMDEATSSVDYQTDHIIQNTIATEFQDCTVLCIAHRLKTIIGYDKIMVLDKGELRQFGIPKKLFENQNGIFRKMCESANIQEENFW
ncbi:hypothetical protein WICMUC_005554 [Wickerhamomyces mucosus]|uniref:Oligomycin resistance ATP-dependent permease YOR1 n=1 Tax=Wickerhamomyces mucosus TaxID=1378264 RepID=A0A9P8T620_9ASCO|nr:hypothetical protein WICMUC_005554 [Wickerhamomyces mucosus]